jgi:hypothetical protein
VTRFKRRRYTRGRDTARPRSRHSPTGFDKLLSATDCQCRAKMRADLVGGHLPTPRVLPVGASRRVRAAVRHLQAAVSLSGNWIYRTTWPGRVSTWSARTSSWACNASTAAGRRVRRIDQEACRRNMQGWPGVLRACDRQRSWRCLRDRRRHGFPQMRAGGAVWRLFWLDGNACQGNRESE